MEQFDSKRAKALQKQRGLQPGFLAAECGITRQYLYLILNGKKAPSEPIVILLAQFLSTSVDYLTGKSDDPRQSERVA